MNTAALCGNILVKTNVLFHCLIPLESLMAKVFFCHSLGYDVCLNCCVLLSFPSVVIYVEVFRCKPLEDTFQEECEISDLLYCFSW